MDIYWKLIIVLPSPPIHEPEHIGHLGYIDKQHYVVKAHLQPKQRYGATYEQSQTEIWHFYKGNSRSGNDIDRGRVRNVS